ncbi:MAG: ArsR/SmtB family transcription factor [Planctomycetota bacterium]
MTTSDSTQACAQNLEPHLDAEVFRALGDATRLALIARLAVAPGPLTVTEAATCCGVHLSGVSRHLAALRDAGLITATKTGREVRYTLDCSALAGTLRGLADALEKCQTTCCSTEGNSK